MMKRIGIVPREQLSCDQELEYYTTRPENAFHQGGNMVIKVLQEKYTADGVHPSPFVPKTSRTYGTTSYNDPAPGSVKQRLTTND